MTGMWRSRSCGPSWPRVLGRERFLTEIRLTAQLDHPHILTLIDSGESAGWLWYVVTLVRGESLRQKLEREKQLPVDEAIAIARQVAGALDYAHRAGIIHRDVKPENILLHEGEAMLADFGIALAVREAAGERLTETGLSVGTPQYMSPEQATGERQLDARSDVYSLGAVLYEMLAGEPPFTGATAQAVIAKLMAVAPTPLSVLRAAIPPMASQTVTRALSKAPADRFDSAAGFAAALTAAATDPPMSRSVAILPFQSLSPNPDNDFFADGITEDVIAQLSKIRSLKVISRGSVMPFKKREHSLREIGATLHVATLLEGSVRQVGDRVRIVAQLIDAEEGRHLWAETYDRQLHDVFAIQTDVALQIAAALKAELSLDERTRSAPGAHQRCPCLPALPPRAPLLQPVHRGGHQEGHRILSAGDRGGSRLRLGVRRPGPGLCGIGGRPGWRRDQAGSGVPGGKGGGYQGVGTR